MNKHALLTGFLGVVIGAVGMYSFTATAPNQQEMKTSPGMDMHADSAMTMGDMVGALRGKDGDDFDQAFLEGMIPHHQGAVDMAKLALEHAGHEEIKAMASDIIDAQQREIEMMRTWQKNWEFVR